MYQNQSETRNASQRQSIPSEGQLLETEPELRHWLARRVFSSEDVDDLVHECICRIIESYRRFRGDSSFRTWAFGICRFVYLEYCRGELRRPIPLGWEAEDTTEGTDAPAAIALPAGSQGADFQDRVVTALAVEMAIEKLPSRLRTVFDLYYRDEMSVREIATLIRRPEGTVKYQLFEIRSRLRVELGVSVRRS